MDKVYVVMARTGEYSDRSEWGVRAFADSESAEAEVKRLVARAMELKVHSSQDGLTGYADYEVRVARGAEFGGHIDYTGIDWSVMEVPFASQVEREHE